MARFHPRIYANTLSEIVSNEPRLRRRNRGDAMPIKLDHDEERLGSCRLKGTKISMFAGKGMLREALSNPLATRDIKIAVFV